MSPDLLRGISVFVAVAKLRSVSHAAVALQMPKSTVSRRVSALERDIGLRLLKRTTKKVELTDEGQNYFLRCQRIIEEAESAHEELTGKLLQPQGHVRAAMTSDFGLRLVSALPDFCRRYPDLSFEFDLTSRRVDPATENCDVAIYIGTPPDSGLTLHKLAEVPLYLYAAPAYLRGRKAPKEPSDLAAHDCILERLHGIEPQLQWVLHNADQRARVKLHGRLILNSIGLIRRLAVAGAGIALLPEDMCRDEVQSGQLAHVLKGWGAPPISIYALTSSRLMPAKTRVFLEFLKAQLQPASS